VHRHPEVAVGQGQVEWIAGEVLDPCNGKAAVMSAEYTLSLHDALPIRKSVV